MANMVLTDFGRNILTPIADASGSPRYWIGYYALAYVPNKRTDNLANAAASNQLTTTGDVIYNIWQGDMVNGYAENNPEDTAAASLFGLTMYDKSIRTNYRYVYDGVNLRNRLVAWKSVTDGHGENTLIRKGVQVYYGATKEESSELPIPAPLYYLGESGNGVLSNDNVSDTVSADYRYYVGTRAGGSYGWQDSANTQIAPTVSDVNLLQSISNFNKFHGTVSSEGYGVSSVSSCHNMSKATKFFPISHYSVVNDNGKKVAETQNNDTTSPLASAIKFTIDLKPITSDAGYTALTYEADDAGDDQDVSEKEVFETKHISFRFNRIGIYAVPMSIHRYSTEAGAEGCNLQKVQFEIEGDGEPQLVAIADVNDTLMSDDPNEEGVAKFNLEFILHVDDSATQQLETATAVYYNLYENDATTWYKNQLLASASIAEAVTDLSLEMNALKQAAGGSGKECCNQDISLDQYASKNHTHDYLKNLVDGVGKAGSVRGIYTCEEGDGKNIDAVFGLYYNSPSMTKRAVKLDAISYLDDNGDVHSIPDSYVYCGGFAATGGVPRSYCITLEQIRTIVKVLGVNWILDNVVTSAGYIQSGETTPIATDKVYIWTSPGSFVGIVIATGEITQPPYEPGNLNQFQTVIITGIEAESLFRDGYSVGVNAIALGESTAASGKNSLVQGEMAYSDSDFSTILGSKSVRCENSPAMTMLGATGFGVSDSDDSILFGNGFNSDGVPSILNEVHSSILGGCLNGTHGKVSGSVLIGDMQMGTGRIGEAIVGASASNALVLRTGDTPLFRTRGQIVDSIAIGEGTASPFTGGHNADLDERIVFDRSMNIAGNTHAYLTDNAQKWFDFKNSTPRVPTMTHAIQVGGCIDQRLHTSLMLSTGGTELGHFSTNTMLAHRASGSSTMEGAQSSIFIGDSNVYGENLYGIIAVGGDLDVPDNSRNSIIIGGSSGSPYWKDDELMTPDEFNQAVESGDLEQDAHYVILGDGTIKVSNISGGYSDQVLSGEADHIYPGVYVDSTGFITYKPMVDIVFANVGAYPLTRTIYHYSARYDRLNPENLDYSVLVGGGNHIDSINTNHALIMGNGNSIGKVNLTNVSIFSNGNTISGSAYIIDSNGKPVYPSMHNTILCGAGISIDLGSTDPFATHSFDNAFVNLTNEYEYLSDILGIFPKPMYYYSMPTDDTPTRPWDVAYSDVFAHDQPFHIDPYLFSNYKDAWMQIDPVDGEAIWLAYKTGDRTDGGSSSDPRWPQVIELAESIQSEEDTYRGYRLYGFADPFDGKSRAKMRTMVGKPKAPMMYTGGIALAGFPTGGNFGLIKIGHESKPVAYINSNPVNTWGTGNLVGPAPVTGTTTCPYGGMLLAIDGTQEPDGTMRLVLRRNIDSGVGTSTFKNNDTYQTCSADTTIEPLKGNQYVVGGSAGVHITFNTATTLDDGDEFTVVIPNTFEGSVVVAGASTNHIDHCTGDLGGSHVLTNGKSYLVRKVSYIATGGSSPSSAFLVLPLI